MLCLKSELGCGQHGVLMPDGATLEGLPRPCLHWPLRLTPCFPKHLLYSLRVMSFDFTAGHIFHVLAFLINFSLKMYFTTIFDRVNTVREGRKKENMDSVTGSVNKLYIFCAHRGGFPHLNSTKLDLRTPASPALPGQQGGPHRRGAAWAELCKTQDTKLFLEQAACFSGRTA